MPIIAETYWTKKRDHSKFDHYLIYFKGILEHFCALMMPRGIFLIMKKTLCVTNSQSSGRRPDLILPKMYLEWVSSSPSLRHIFRFLHAFYWSQLNEIIYIASSHYYLAIFLDLFRNSKYFSKNLHLKKKFAIGTVSAYRVSCTF